MEVLKCYSFFDKKLGRHFSVSVFPDEVSAKRSYENFVRTLDSSKGYYMSFHLDEYAVYYIGEFNSETGEFKPCQPVVAFELSLFKDCMDKNNKVD